MKKQLKSRKDIRHSSAEEAPGVDVNEYVTEGLRLAPDVITELVLERFAGYRTRGTLTPIAELQQKFAAKGYRLTPHSISRYIMRGFKKGLVEVVSAPTRGTVRQWKHEAKQADGLEKAFGKYGLQGAIVIGGIPPPIPGAYVDDAFYQALGQAMAERIAKGMFIRNKEKVGVGSGRAVYNTVKALEKYKPLNIQDPTLVSLSGTAWSRPDRRPRSVDADFNVSLFRECCQRAQPLYISYPLTDGVNRLRTFLHQPTWEEESCPDIALIGVGCLQQNHRFWVSSADDDSVDPLLRPVRQDLSRLVELFRHSVEGDYSPVADIANRLVFVPHPDPSVARRFDQDRIRKAIAALNSKLLNVSDEQFQQIKSVALIAGETNKVFAIRELLINPSYNITLLCTDSETANELLRLERQYPAQVASTAGG